MFGISGKKKGFTLVEIMVVVAIIGILGAIGINNFVTVIRTSRRNACITNLKKVDDAKSLWAMDTNAFASDEPAMEDIIPDYIRKGVVCPAGGEYAVGDLATLPTCTVDGHTLSPSSGAGEEEEGGGSEEEGPGGWPWKIKKWLKR